MIRGDARERHGAGLAFALLLLGLLALFSDAASSMAGVWIDSSVYHHGIIVAPICAWLIATRWRENGALARSDWAGLPIVALSSAIWLFGRAASVDLIGHVAVVVAVWGAFVTVFGRALALRFAFPLSFLIFMVPAGEELTPWLQAQTASAVAGLLNLSGVTTVQDGVMLTTSAGRFEVAESCSGLRFLLASLMISTVVSWFAFTSWRKRAAFILLAIAAAILANWLRAYLIVLLATATDRQLGVGPEHVLLGWLLYGALLTALILAARGMKDPIASSQAPALRAAPRASVSIVPVAFALLTASTAAAYDTLVVSRDLPPSASVAARPFVADGYRVVAPLLDWQAHSPYADARSTTGYAAPNASIILSLASFEADRPGAEIVNRDVRAADGVRWRRLSLDEMEVEIAGRAGRATIETVADDNGDKLDVVTLYWVRDRAYDGAMQAKTAVAFARLMGATANGGAVFIAAPHRSNANPREAINSFLTELEPFESWLARSAV